MKKIMSLTIIFTIFTILPSWSFTISSSSTVKSPKPNFEKHIERLNILVSKIENGYIYDKDGNKYKIYSFTKIIDNRQNFKHKVTIGELVFKNGKLAIIILKGGK